MDLVSCNIYLFFNITNRKYTAKFSGVENNFYLEQFKENKIKPDILVFYPKK